jgi:hypothetical protein
MRTEGTNNVAAPSAVAANDGKNDPPSRGTNSANNTATVPAALTHANNACMIFFTFILPIISLKLSAPTSYCPARMLTFIPRFAHLMNGGVMAPSGLCAYEISCALIVVLRTISIMLFGRLTFHQFFDQSANSDRRLFEFFPKGIWIYLGGSAVLFVSLLTTFDWSSRREDIKMIFITLSLGGGFAFFTPGVLMQWALVMRARMMRRQANLTWRGENDRPSS